MSNASVLVTGAAGGLQGSTGFHVARLLLERGQRVRAFVHHVDERSEPLRVLGAEVVEGDLRDLGSVMAAMGGIDRVYFTYPVAEGLLEAAATVATAAHSVGVEQVVNLSQWLQTDWRQPTPHQIRHWIVERIFDRAAVGSVHLDAVVFYENLRLLARRSLDFAGVIALPWGPPTATIPMVSAEDVARVAAEVLTGPVLPNGTVLRLVAEAVANTEIADAFSEVLGRRVEYVEINVEHWADAAAAGGINAIAVEHLSHLFGFLGTRPPQPREAYAGSDTLDRITGAAPKTLRQFLHEHKAGFAQTVTQ